jgi:hypothetical protein
MGWFKNWQEASKTRREAAPTLKESFAANKAKQDAKLAAREAKKGEWLYQNYTGNFGSAKLLKLMGEGWEVFRQDIAVKNGDTRSVLGHFVVYHFTLRKPNPYHIATISKP